MDLEQRIREIVREELAKAKPANDSDYLTTAEAAKLAKVTEGTVRRWARSGRLTTHRAGRVVRVRRSDLLDLLRSSGADNMTPEAMAARDFG
jgi:excisionase family DNA binding protein